MIPELENRPFEVLESKVILDKGTWMHLRQEKVRTPQGVVIPSWFVLDFPTWVQIIAITKDGNFIIEDQYRHGIGETHYEVPAGCVDPGETPLQAAKRELSEETGYEGGEWSLLSKLSPNPGNHSNWSYTYVAKGVEKRCEVHQEETEDIHVHVFTREQVLEILNQDGVVQAQHAAPLWKYFAQNK